MEVKPSIYIKHLANLFFGMYQRKFSHEWDLKLVEILEFGSVLEAGEYTLTIQFQGDAIEIWCSNRWYAFGHAYRVNGSYVQRPCEFRPSIKTMVKLWDIFQIERDKNLDENYRNLFNSGIEGGR